MATISGLERLEKCVMSDAPEMVPHVDEGDNVYSAHGRAVHAYLDAIASGVKPSEALAAVEPIHMDAVRAINLEEVPHSQMGAWRSEAAFALDYDAGTARALQLTGHRAYPEMGPTEIAGTADLVGLDPDGETVVVLDVKTGRRWLGRPSQHLQMLGYGLAAMAVYGRTRVRLGFLFVRKDEDPQLVVEDMTEMEMAVALNRIRSIMERADFHKRLGLVDPKPGEHCRYCPAFRACPAHVNMLAPLLSNHMDIARASLLGPGQRSKLSGPDGQPLLVVRLEDIPAAMERADAAMGLLKRLKHELEEAVRAHGAITMSDGRVLCEVEKTREKIDPELARPVLQELFGDELTNEAIEVKTTLTKAAITRLVNERTASTKERKGALTEAVLTAIRKKGGVSVTRYFAVEFKTPAKLPAK